VKEVGSVTRALCNSKKGDLVGIRGPLGNGFPVEEMKGKNVVAIAGGVGIAPLKPLLLSLIGRANLTLLYGFRSPDDFIFKDEVLRWAREIDVKLTVDVPDEDWPYHVGLVTSLLDGLDIPKSETVFAVCGPSPMLRATATKLSKMGYPLSGVYVSLERLMHCGVGKCGHCNVGRFFVCKDGPVFRASEVPFEELK